MRNRLIAGRAFTWTEIYERRPVAMLSENLARELDALRERKGRLFLIGVTTVVLLALWLFLEKTRFGLIVRAGARDPLVLRVLGIMDQQIHAVAELEDLGGNRVEPRRRLVVGDVGDARAIPVDAVPDGRAAVGHRSRFDLRRADLAGGAPPREGWRTPRSPRAPPGDRSR